MGIGFVAGHPQESHFSYDQAFLAEYETLNMAERDATIHFGFTVDGTAMWSELARMGYPLDAFELSARHGLEDGFCISMTIEGRKSLASISRDLGDRPTPGEIELLVDALALASLEVSRDIVPPPLSPRTREFLDSAVSGHSDAQLAEALNLSIHGARARRKAALAELGARSPSQALAKAISNRSYRLAEVL